MVREGAKEEARRPQLSEIVCCGFTGNSGSPDLAIIAPEMQTALGPNLLTSFPTIGPLKE